MITTERLLLRRALMTDLDDLHAVLTNPNAMRYWSSLPHESVDQTRGFLSAMVGASPEHSDDFVVEFEGRAIGKAGCWRPGEIGFIFHPSCWGKGLAHESLVAIIPHVFDTLPAETLIADVDPRNAASLKLLDRLGFIETGRETGTVLLGDEWCDSVYLELTKAEAARRICGVEL